MDKDSILFNILCTIHVIFWVFVLFAFLNLKLAKINLYYVIPITYILQMMPFHIFEKSKEKIYPDTYKEKRTDYNKKSVLPDFYFSIEKKLRKCYFNPLSAQGMMIFGAITCAYAIKYNKSIIY